MLYSLEHVEQTRAGFTLSVEVCHLEKGGIYAVVGPNGCGKSTFLNLLAFLDSSCRGSVVFDGEKVERNDQRGLLRLRRRIGYLLQNPYLFNMSVRDNIRCGLKIRGLPQTRIAERVEEVMSRLSLTDLAGRNAHALSGGEIQRVALARTLALEADVYLLDEPTASVDRRHVRNVEKLILQLNADRRSTVVLATHSLDQAYRMSKTPITIMDGRVSEIGYENVFPGRLATQPDGVLAVALDEGITVHVAHGKDGRVSIAIDPKDIVLSNTRIETSALNEFPGTVVKLEDVDGSVRVFLDVGVTLCALITRRSLHDMHINIGERVFATFKANAVQVV